MRSRTLVEAGLLLSLLLAACSSPSPETTLVFGPDAGPAGWWDVRAGTGWDAVLSSSSGSVDSQDGEVLEPCNSDGECEARLGPLPACRLPRCDYATGSCEIAVASDRSACDDGNPCTQDDNCLSGFCSGVAVDCDDNDQCTLDSCDATGDGNCTNEPHEGSCDDGDSDTRDDRCIDGLCVGQPIVCDDDNACTIDTLLDGGECDYDAAAADGLPCDDGETGTVEDRCASGYCDGYVPGCDDGNPCTVDSLGGGGECVHNPNAADGRECDDGDAMTIDDQCQGGSCAGTTVDCDDGNACTVDSFDPSSGACDNDAAAANGSECDDGDPRTVEDRCSGGECEGSTVPCDDGDPCTLDSYDQAQGACVHDAAGANGALCDDDDSCTYDDRCTGGSCKGVAVDCDDGNVCTDDSCEEGSCLHANNAVSCDDGVACTVDDHCEAGACVGDDSACPTCEPSFSDAVVSVWQLQLGPAGANNALAPLAPYLDPTFESAIASGTLHVLMELPSVPLPADEFRVNFYTQAAPVDDSCDPSQVSCAYDVPDAELDAECQALEYIDGVEYQDGYVLGGRERTLTIRFALASGEALEFPIESAFLRGLADTSGNRLNEMRGAVIGAVRRTALVEMLRAAPSILPGEPETRLDQLVTWNFDLDEDGEPESATVSLLFWSNAARIHVPEEGLSCSELLSCLGGCEDGDSACQQACVDDASPTGAQQFWSLVNCIQDNCPDGDQTCISQQCTDEYVSCLYG